MTNSDILRMMANAIRSCGGENKEFYKKQADSMENLANDKEDYCEIGMNSCTWCGWRHPRNVQVGSCPQCHHSFCS